MTKPETTYPIETTTPISGPLRTFIVDSEGHDGLVERMEAEGYEGIAVSNTGCLIGTVRVTFKKKETA